MEIDNSHLGRASKGRKPPEASSSPGCWESGASHGPELNVITLTPRQLPGVGGSKGKRPFPSGQLLWLGALCVDSKLSKPGAGALSVMLPFGSCP